MTIGTESNFTIKTLAPVSFRLMGEHGSVLLEIMGDGTVRGKVEDAGEAAKVFVDAIRGYLESMIAETARTRTASLGDGV